MDNGFIKYKIDFLFTTHEIITPIFSVLYIRRFWRKLWQNRLYHFSTFLNGDKYPHSPMHFLCSLYAFPQNFLFSFESWDQEFQEDGGEAGAGIGGAVVEASDDYTDVVVEF